jgi:hypothetical protein
VVQKIGNHRPEYSPQPSMCRGTVPGLVSSVHVRRKTCTSRPAFPYSTPLAKMRQRRSAIRKVITAFKRHLPMDRALEFTTSKTSDPLPTTLADCEAESHRLNATIKALEKTSVPLRSEVAIFNTPLHRQTPIEPVSIWRTPRKRSYDSHISRGATMGDHKS